ncbi:MAG: lipoyl synthase [Clostridia bacterium]
MYERKPQWLKRSYNPNNGQREVLEIIKKYGLNTVCTAAGCPNKTECHNSGTATFMLLGKYCTRNCAFCKVEGGAPQTIDAAEPENIALAANSLKLKHVVVTSVTRDDIEDGGAAHFASTVTALKRHCPNISVEVLIPDFQGSETALRKVIASNPDVINHNMETVSELYGEVRPEADYRRSLKLIENVKKQDDTGKIITKSGFMLGLGESSHQVYQLLKDLRGVDCDIVTIGQYLRPSIAHRAVSRYVHPEEFEAFGSAAYALGFKYVASAPLVRSSYHALQAVSAVRDK